MITGICELCCEFGKTCIRDRIVSSWVCLSTAPFTHQHDRCNIDPAAPIHGGNVAQREHANRKQSFSQSVQHVPYTVGRKGRECRARYSQKRLLRVKSSALVTGFVLAEGTHQTRCLFGEFQFRNIDISLTTGGRVPDVTTSLRCALLTSRPAEGFRPAPPRLVCPPKARLQQLPGPPGRMPQLRRPRAGPRSAAL